jgi:hypothetical protein
MCLFSINLKQNTMATNMRYYNRYNYFPSFSYPIVVNNSCSQQAQVKEAALVNKLQNVTASTSAEATQKLIELKKEAIAIAEQKSSCNSFSGTRYVVPVVRYTF